LPNRLQDLPNPTSEERLAIRLGCKTVDELVEFLSTPHDPSVGHRGLPVYPDDEPDLDETQPPPSDSLL